ncbi:MAG: cystathionine beta-lyase [Gammaproteobacteria bacterium]|nr:cystathionine beta-lyase [Gammaproteobacteria bacterium]
MNKRRHRDVTDTIHLGREPDRHSGLVNPPVYHASTVLFPNLEALEASYEKRFQPGHVHYGRFGTPTLYALEQAVADLEQGYAAVSFPSGLAAIATTLTALVKAGDHILVSDSVYLPTRAFCTEVLGRLGVETTYYDPLIGADISKLIRANTRLVYLESPGSLTFEVQDVPAIAAAAKQQGLAVMMDNTWGTPLHFKAFAHGVDISIHAATKYIVGHADAMLGLAVTTTEYYQTLKNVAIRCGQTAGPDDAYLALRGLRSLSVRLQQHQSNGLELTRWLKQRPEVLRIIHPALPEDPGHRLWKRDFTGACGLFGVVLEPVSRNALAVMLDHMELFGMGFSWGGFESLMIPVYPERIRTATTWEPGGQLLRIHAGLEDPADLIADLEAGFDRLNAAD